jgi:coproporphyrinogen III oxidase-like Fe-S oxidoreductase
LDEYISRVQAVGHGRSEGILLSEDERRRRTAILGLGNLDRGVFIQKHGNSIEHYFPTQIEAFDAIGALTVSPTHYAWTALGQKYRDVLVQTLFSPQVFAAVTNYSYDE